MAIHSHRLVKAGALSVASWPWTTSDVVVTSEYFVHVFYGSACKV